MLESIPTPDRRPVRERLLDWLFIFAIFAIYAASPPPDVNEAHYLTKARHFWDPNWLMGDLFLESGFAHWLFYVTFGWLTVVFDLPTTAWIGRVAGWAMLAWGWESLAQATGLKSFPKLFATVCLLALVQIANLSGEWLVGGIEAKVPSYALVFYALSHLVRGRWFLVWPVLGLAIGFHPLVGGWSFLACIFVRFSDIRRSRIVGSEVASLASGVLLAAALGVWPIMNLGTNVEGYYWTEAAEIYVRRRVNHHLYFWDFARIGIVGFGLLILAWRELSRAGRLLKLSPVNAFAAASLILVVCGIVLSTLSDFDWSRHWANSLLRFYWFRLADIALPCAVALGLATKLNDCLASPNQAGNLPEHGLFRTNTLRRLALALGLFLATGICAMAVADRCLDGRPAADRQSLPSYPDSSVRTWETFRNWVRACQWIKDNTPTDAVFLTPRQQQTFKWYAERVEYVNWKDIPQDPLGIFQWEHRLNLVFGPSWSEPPLSQLEPQDLRWLLLDGTRARFVVMEQENWQQLESSGDTAPLELVYPSDPTRRTTYVVLKVSRGADMH